MEKKQKIKESTYMKSLPEKKRLKKTLYYICIGAFLACIISAFLLPKLIFQIRDTYQMKNIFVEARESVDFELLNVTYEKEKGNRLQNFAEGIAQEKDYYVTSTEYEITEEIYNIAIYLLYEEFLRNLDKIGILFDSIMIMDETPFDIKEAKRYVVYSDDFQNGVSLMMWYLHLEYKLGSVEILADTEDDTIYYIKLTIPNQEYLFESLLCWLDQEAEFRKEVWYSYQEYYLSDSFQEEFSNIQTTKSTSIKINSSSSEKILYKKEKNLTDFSIESDNNKEIFYQQLDIGTHLFFLPYEDTRLHFLVDAKYTTNEKIHLEMGLKEIAEQIPEFQDTQIEDMTE